MNFYSMSYPLKMETFDLEKYYLGSFTKENIINKWKKKNRQYLLLRLGDEHEQKMKSPYFNKYFRGSVKNGGEDNLEKHLIVIAKINYNYLPLVIDISREFFSLESRGCAYIKAGKYKYCIYPVDLDYNKEVIYYESIRGKKDLTEQLKKEIRKNIVFKYIWESKNIKECCFLIKDFREIVSVGDEDTYICEEDKPEIIPTKLAEKYFENFNMRKTLYKDMLDSTKKKYDNTDLFEKINFLLKSCNKDLIFLKNSFEKNFKSL